MSPEQLQLNGIMRVSDYADIAPLPRDFAIINEAMDIMSQDPSDSNPHGGSSVFMITMPDDKKYRDLSVEGETSEYRNFTQHYYVRVLSKVLDLQYHIKRPINFRVDKATASDLALGEQKDALFRYVNRKKPGAIFMKDVELNLKDSSGKDKLDANGNPLPDPVANERLSDLTEFLSTINTMQNKRIPIFRILPKDYFVDEPTPDDLQAIENHDRNQELERQSMEFKTIPPTGFTLASLREVTLLQHAFSLATPSKKSESSPSCR